jgi:hypothetical protein
MSTVGDVVVVDLDEAADRLRVEPKWGISLTI